MNHSNFVIFILSLVLLSSCGTKEQVLLKEDHSLSTQPVEEISVKKDVIEETKESEQAKESPHLSTEPSKKDQEKKAVESTNQLVKQQNPQPNVVENKISINDQEKMTKEVTPPPIENTVKNETTKESTEPKQKIETPKSTEVQKPITPTKVGVPVVPSLLPEGNSKPRDSSITHIVTHFISNASINPTNPYNVQDIRKIFLDYGLSAHYLIGRNGEIFQLVPENRIAFHAGKGHLPNFPQYKDALNAYSIGIEIMAVGTKEEMSNIMSASTYDSIDPQHIGYTDAQYQSLKTLIEDILDRNVTIKKDRQHIIGHDEYAPGRKSDPGSLFEWGNIGL
ncbi:N-acetylmuramoyl-L-alanine amidase [Metabacillus halosaccharovorans]|uniref:N-acetylmuramoyl-L-alanine amidase n=1 Tax=Metabacillus halosaccharovorans TaxID=930124 RepID=UPI0020420590|nr:N-acetylmuramoyl-L-alanine amidase [Metabacillus halosaccharovorans]MCM3443098.1 N-acetylmuramoyl-L-alanine amidase [Metabacillus halosaccharovorans]